jgi:hypothetical protein
MNADVHGFESHMTAGSHHLLVFFAQGVQADTPIEACSGLEFQATPYGTQLPDDAVTLPDGIVESVPAGRGIRLQAHYLNTGSADLHAKVAVTFHVVRPDPAAVHAGIWFFINTNIDVPPLQQATATRSCPLPPGIHVLTASSHMHRHGIDFQSTLGGRPLYATQQWDSPKATTFDPPLLVGPNDEVSWTCTYQNDGMSSLSFGESANTNEMCIVDGVFYPVSPGTGPLIMCY